MQLTTQVLTAGCGCTPARASAWLAPIQSACNEFQINTPLRAAAFLAQIGHESMYLMFTREIWGPTPVQALYEPPSSKAAELGNTEVGDGHLFFGRGLIEITGRRNYTLAAIALDLDLLNHPEQLEEPMNAARSAAWFWANHGLNALADQQKLIQITRIINGGLTGLPNRQRLFLAAKKAFGC